MGKSISEKWAEVEAEAGTQREAKEESDGPEGTDTKRVVTPRAGVQELGGHSSKALSHKWPETDRSLGPAKQK